MLITRFFILVAMIFPAFSSAKVEKNLKQRFLSYDQFLELSDEQKKSYILQVEKLVVQLGENRQLVSLEESSPFLINRLSRLFVQQASAEDSYTVKGCLINNVAGLSNTDLVEAFPQTYNCSERTPETRSVYKPEAVERVESLLHEFISRVQNNSLTPSEPHYREYLVIIKSIIADIRTGGVQGRSLPADWMQSEYDQISSFQSNSTSRVSVTKAGESASRVRSSGSRRSSGAQSERVLSKSASRDQSGTSASQSSSPRVSSSPKTESSKTSSPQSGDQSNPKKSNADESFEDIYQCLYAGFVIPKSGSGCQPYTTLPYETSFFDPKTFRCSQKDQIICNPLLFGYEEVNCKANRKGDCSGKKPVCVYRSQDATKNCYELAQRKKTLNRTADFWKSSDGEKLYKEFTRSLSNLCDRGHLEKRHLRQAVFDDITKTCDVAFSVFEENVKAEFLPKSLMPQKTDSSSGTR